MAYIYIYIVHDSIHYNALKLRDSQEEGELNKEENSRESTFFILFNREDMPHQTHRTAPLQRIHTKKGTTTRSQETPTEKEKKTNSEPHRTTKHRRTKAKQQTALDQATKTPLQPVGLVCDHGHIKLLVQLINFSLPKHPG
jgi:hypothetical protein